MSRELEIRIADKFTLAGGDSRGSSDFRTPTLGPMEVTCSEFYISLRQVVSEA